MVFRMRQNQFDGFEYTWPVALRRRKPPKWRSDEPWLRCFCEEYCGGRQTVLPVKAVSSDPSKTKTLVRLPPFSQTGRAGRDDT